MAPAVEEEVPVGLKLGEFHPVMRLEAVPEVRAAVAHELHLPLVFVVAGGELDPVVGKGEFPHDSVVGTGPIVGEERFRLDPIRKAFRHRGLRRRPELLRVQMAEAAAASRHLSTQNWAVFPLTPAISVTTQSGQSIVIRVSIALILPSVSFEDERDVDEESEK